MPQAPRHPSPQWTANLRTHVAAYRQELVRVCPEVLELDRAELPNDLLPVEVLGVLRTLPDGSGLERLHTALAAYRETRKRGREST